VSLFDRFTVTTPVLRGLALASVIANVSLVVTGGAVRLTASGLGCPTWPRCTDGSYTTTAEMGVHGAIEFGNRMVTFVVGLIALAGLIAAILHRPRRRDLIVIATVILLGIPLQGVIGGLTVLSNLNPWVVGLHFLGSIAVIAVAYAFWRRIGHTEPAVLPRPLRTLAHLTAVASAAVLVLGVVVTGSGPHSGDHGAKRNGLDPQAVSQLHADLVFLLIGLSVALWFALRAVHAPAPTVRAAAMLIAVELSQGLVGFAQYLTQLPVLLVGLHMLGACLVWLATLGALANTRRTATSPPLPPVAPARVPLAKIASSEAQ
jgi:cytochrome c oxidase assembly protein subunit 15